ncbi:MAG: hypothetical protein K9L30_17970 [Desulfobacterales bacterium]|nr:hypothetical protein [Desulfobacterales bacterium]
MKKIISLLLMTSIATVAHAADEISVSGILSLRSGSQVPASQIESNSWKYDGRISFKTIDGIKIDVDVSDIKSIHIDHLDTDRDGDIRESQENVITVSLKNGNEAIMRSMEGNRGLSVTFQDSFTSKIIENKYYKMNGASENHGEDSDVVHIDFTGSGNIKKNYSSGKYYPVNYNYDPYTGEKLSFGSVSQKK